MQKPEFPKFPNFPSKGLRNEMLRFILLRHLSWRTGYPYALLKAIQGKKVWILKGMTKNDLYNAIASLEKEGYIKGKSTMKGGKVQKYYELTASGKKVVKASEQIMYKSFLEMRKLMREESNE